MIRPEEIDDIFDIGELNQAPVKVIKTIGGFYVATAKDAAGKDQVLSGANHPALVRHAIKKKFGTQFIPNMLKNEHEKDIKVFEKTEFLPKLLVDKGYDLHILSDDLNVSISLSHYGAEVMGQTALNKSDGVELQAGVNIKDFSKATYAQTSGVSASIVAALASAAKEMGKNTISYSEKPKKYDVDHVLRKLNEQK